MKFVEPSFGILNVSGTIQDLEAVARTCYKSEDRIKEGSAETMVKNLIKNNHTAMLEFVDLTVRIVTDRGVANEIVRHRIASYAQECVSGNTIIKKGKNPLTIKDLYNRQENDNCYDKTHNKTISLRSINDDGIIIPNKFNKVFYKGAQEVYEVVSELGYRIKCTMNHRFLSGVEYKYLRDLSVGSCVTVNGKPSISLIEIKDILRLYEEVGMSPKEISEHYNVGYRGIIKRLKSAGVFISRKNDKNKEKYNNNHTDNSTKKMVLSILDGYKNGRVVWNKGIKEDDSSSVKKQTESLRNNHNNNGIGDKNSRWLGGPKTYEKARISKLDTSTCELCGNDNSLEVHHKDKNIYNNNKENLIKVCCKCHNQLHHGWHIGVIGIQDKIKSITYVGIEDTYDIEMKGPYHNYVADGFIVHNSTRYVSYEDGVEFIKPLFIENGSLSELAFERVCEQSEKVYGALMLLGAKPQDARAVLPMCLKTELVMKTNVREWRHFFKLRCAKAAHPEMRRIAIPMLEAFKKRLPIVFDDL